MHKVLQHELPKSFNTAVVVRIKVSTYELSASECFGNWKHVQNLDIYELMMFQLQICNKVNLI